MGGPDMDTISALRLTEWNDETLAQAVAEIQAEQHRRHVIAAAPYEAERIAEQYQAAIGRTPGAAWVQPLGAHDAYVEGAEVTHDGKRWRSACPANVWEPGTGDLWELVEEDVEPAPEPEAPAWETGVAYKQGQRVEYQGVVYRVVQAHTSAAHWTPDQVASLYSKA